ncbi:hypothetical protein C8R43DRAFT_1126880 [Mycena crocata]|nr:hypothetical protein C8R43DRAFT_1126880 [Mycena crocata]
MSSTGFTSATPDSTNMAAAEPRLKFSFGHKPIPVSAGFVEQGLSAHAAEQGTSVSAPTPALDVRRDGGIPSSPAFAAEQAKDAERFAALNLETRDQSLPLSGQLKRDFAVAQASPQPPPGFAAGPSMATRPVSQTASLAAEADGSQRGDGAHEDANEDPLLLPSADTVSRALHLAVAPKPKPGSKEKGPTTPATVALLGGNLIRVGGHVVAINKKLDAVLLSTDSQIRGLRSKVDKLNVGKLEERQQIVETQVQNCLVEVKHSLKQATSGHTSDARVALHTSQIAELTETLETVCHDTEHVAKKGDMNALADSVQEGFNDVHDLIDDAVRPVSQMANANASLLATIESRIATLEMQQKEAARLRAEAEKASLATRENVARIQLDLGQSVVKAHSASASTAAYSFLAASNAKKVKRKASVELVSGPAKRVNSRPAKSACQFWVRLGPLNPDTKNPAPGLFKKLIDVAVPGYALPTDAYIERVAADAAVLAVGFTAANDANGFVGVWRGANATMPVALRAISAVHATSSSSSVAVDPLAFLTGS